MCGRTLMCYSILEFIFFIELIFLPIKSFNTLSDLDNIENLKIQTNFKATLNNEPIINIFENPTKDNQTDELEEFFNKYNLKEGQSLYDNENLKSNFSNLYKMDLTIIILSLTILSLIILWPIVLLITIICKLDFAGEDECGCRENFFKNFGKTLIIIRPIVLFVLLMIFVGFFINYNQEFGNDFSDFYEGIKYSQTSFHHYYIKLFDFKEDMILVIILLSISVFCYVICLIFYFLLLNDQI